MGTFLQKEFESITCTRRRDRGKEMETVKNKNKTKQKSVRGKMWFFSSSTRVQMRAEIDCLLQLKMYTTVPRISMISR